MLIKIAASSQARRFGIVNGKRSDIKNFPYQSAFLIDNKLKCGGTVISSNFILTAAHCTSAFKTNITIRVGSTLKNEGGQAIQVIQVYDHPKFDRVKLVYDFSLLQLEKPIEFNDKVQLAKLPDQDKILPDDTECFVSGEIINLMFEILFSADQSFFLFSGWGKIESEERPKELRAVKVLLVNQQFCQDSYNTTRVKFRITDAMTCAQGSQNQDACTGDSVRYNLFSELNC